MRYAFKRSQLAFAMAALVLTGTMSVSRAAQTPSVMEGLAACQERCDGRNPEVRGQCRHACALWWYCNGSDASYGLYVEICEHLKNEPSAIVTTAQPPRPPPVRATTPTTSATPSRQ